MPPQSALFARAVLSVLSLSDLYSLLTCTVLRCYTNLLFPSLSFIRVTDIVMFNRDIKSRRKICYYLTNLVWGCISKTT